jgi:hypothetical protein
MKVRVSSDHTFRISNGGPHIIGRAQPVEVDLTDYQLRCCYACMGVKVEAVPAETIVPGSEVMPSTG